MMKQNNLSLMKSNSEIILTFPIKVNVEFLSKFVGKQKV